MKYFLFQIPESLRPCVLIFKPILKKIICFGVCFLNFVPGYLLLRFNFLHDCGKHLKGNIIIYGQFIRDRSTALKYLEINRVFTIL